MTARTRAALVVALGAAAVLPLVATGSDPARGAANAAAGATAYARSGSTGQSGYVTVEGDGARSGRGTSVKASTAGGKGTAEATAGVSPVNIFSGLVTATSVQVRASAARGSTTLGGGVDGLAIQGKQLGAHASAARYDLNGYGTLEVLTATEEGITGLRATLTKDYKRYPAGSSISVAHATATATDGAPPARPRPERARRTRPTRRPRRTARARERSRPRRERPARRRAAPDLDALPTDRGYVFPVYGSAYGYANDWGAPRQHTGTHEGNDIFAPTGTPVLAATDGVLYRVGTRRVPGNRLWLRGSGGDTFLYAHLSAFAQDARNGARVRAGDAIGFVGSTGDAERTPPHLHFEIHPRDGEAVNPYPFLRAWEARRDVPHAAWLARYGDDPGSRPGALVVIEDFLARQ